MTTFQTLDVAEINERLILHDQVVCPVGTYRTFETIVVPPGKYLHGHPNGTTLVVTFGGPGIHVETPAAEDAVTGIRVVFDEHQAVEVEKERIDNLPFPTARRTMAKALREDAELRNGYVSNIAMLLHDYYGITDRNKRNEAAAAILTLIFED